MDTLFAAHSGVRYLVLLAGLVALVWFAWGMAAGKPFGRPAPVMLRVFLGVLDLQVLLGIVLLVGGRRTAGIWGHVALMLAAVVTAHALNARHKRRPLPAGFGLPLLSVLVPLVLIVLGILAIGRPVF